MENADFLFNSFIFLAATCLVVPLARRFKLGSILGYLAAGILIGPFGLGLIGNLEAVRHFGEFGIIMMLFLIGLELEPQVLWRLRKTLLGLGGLQVAVTSAAFTGIGIGLGFPWQASLAAGLALSLSSTALVLQMFEEKGLLQTAAGQSSFGILLFQDIAAIPILILIPFLAGTSSSASVPQHGLSLYLPAWAFPLAVIGVVAAIVPLGHFFSRIVFRFVAQTNLREIFTTTSLALIVGITLLMQSVGVSPALGAFVAGVVLATSEYRHTLHADIQPFKSLLLGLFFISIGMGINFGLLSAQPGHFLAALILLITVKALILYALGRCFGLRSTQNAFLALGLAQGGEFAFVLFQQAAGLSLLSPDQSAFLTLTVALSMAATPFLMIINDRFLVPRFLSRLPERSYDAVHEKENPVILAGYGRFGQIIGRFLRAQGIKITILEKDPDQIELLRRFGNRVYFGDASRLDLLESAGAAHAKLFIVAVDDADSCLQIVKLARHQFPHLKIFARARNRRHAYELHKAGVQSFRRETFDSALTLATEAMKILHFDSGEVEKKAVLFKEHDEKMLVDSFKFFEKEPELIAFTRQASGELEQILGADIGSAPPQSK